MAVDYHISRVHLEDRRQGGFKMMKAKITVLKRMANQDLAEEYRKDEYNKRYPVSCNLFGDGQEFILES